MAVDSIEVSIAEDIIRAKCLFRTGRSSRWLTSTWTALRPCAVPTCCSPGTRGDETDKRKSAGERHPRVQSSGQLSGPSCPETGQTHHVILEPQEVGVAEVPFLEEQCGAALLQVPPCQPHQSPDLAKRRLLSTTLMAMASVWKSKGQSRGVPGSSGFLRDRTLSGLRVVEANHHRMNVRRAPPPAAVGIKYMWK